MSTKLKRGQRPEGWKSECPKFVEYYQKYRPDWTLEQCQNAARFFCKSSNYQCIEYYQKNYPDATPEEQERMLKEAKLSKRYNSPLCIEYYQKNYPNATPEEQERMLKEAKENYLKKRPILKGENNPSHHSHTTTQERKQRSPMSIEFYIHKYPDATPEEQKRLWEEYRTKHKNIMKDKSIHTTCKENWMKQGYTEEEAIKKVSERQKTFSLDKCILRNGEEKGQDIFNNRQKRWMKSLMKNFEIHGDGRSSQSKFAIDMIYEICKRLNISTPLKEKFIMDKQTHKSFAYDFCYKKKIIEFNGDFWHCNPVIYKEDFFNPTKKMYAHEIWSYDKSKQICAESHGYEILYIWESDYNNDKDKEINKCVEFLND